MSDSGFFDSISDAVSNIGNLLESPASASADLMNTASSNLGWKYDSSDNPNRLDFDVLQAGFGSEVANDVWGTMLDVQMVSDELGQCGATATAAIKSATTDYIRNTGIQEAGRDLNNRLKSTGNIADCVSGFATLFESKGIIDDAYNIGDMEQIMERVSSIISNASNPSKIADMVANAAAVQDLIAPYAGFCGQMKTAMDGLVNADKSALAASLNKLSQWAAFTKLATSDPCALVNNEKMLSHVASPVLDDIISLYTDATGGGTLADILDISPAALIGTTVPKLDPNNFVFSLPFDSYSSSMPTDLDGITSSLSGAVSSSAMSFVEGEGWVENKLMDLKSDFTKGIAGGKNLMDDSMANFAAAKNNVDFKSVVSSDNYIETATAKIEDTLIDTSRVVDKTSEEVTTRAEAAAATLLKPDSGSGIDEVTLTAVYGKGKEIISSPYTSPSVGTGAKVTVNPSLPAYPTKMKEDMAFDTTGISTAKSVCKCYPTTSNKDPKHSANQWVMNAGTSSKLLYDANNMTEELCIMKGWNWNCAVDLRKSQKQSKDSFNHSRNVEHENILPTNTAFDVSDIGGA